MPQSRASAPATSVCRILLADDHQLFLHGLRALLEKQPDLEVVAEAQDGLEAVELARRERPRLVIMDLSMPGMNGIEATRRISAELPEVKILCLSMHTEARFVEAALEAGASGYLLKDCALGELVNAITAVLSDQAYLSPAVTGSVLKAMQARRPKVERSAYSILTDREREVLQLLAEGHAAKEIAARLRVSVKTVATHREHLMAKLDIRSVAGLTKYAILEGLTSNEP